MGTILAVTLIWTMTTTPIYASQYTINTFNDGWHTCLFNNPSHLVSATANSDGDLYASASTDDTNHYLQASAFAYKERWFTAGTQVTLYGVGTVSGEHNGSSHSSIVAYLANPGSIRYNSGMGCMNNGGAINGDVAILERLTNGESVSNSYRSASVTYTIPENGMYPIVIYADANTGYTSNANIQITNPYVVLYW